jgi:DNA-binding LacI/PurR family transcriptional regulator
MSGVTIYQVARQAGVSPTTVSNLLNGRSGRMLPATRRRVERAIRELGYQPNRAARQLRTGRVQVIGLIVPSVANPFWGTLAQHLEAAAVAAGYRILLCNSERDPDREGGYVEELWADGIRGIILCTSLPSLDHLPPLADHGLAIVAFDRTAQATDPPGLVNISVDNAAGAALATRHLLDLGHRRIAFVSGALGSINRKERHRGFVDALRGAGLGPDDGIIWSGATVSRYGDRDVADLGRRAASDLLAMADPPTGIVAINDMCALGVYAGIRDAGMAVGRDVSVTGFDDIPLAGLIHPPLSTVRQPLTEMAKVAFDQLRERLENTADDAGTPRGRSILMRPELVIRASTGPAEAPRNTPRTSDDRQRA